MNIGWIICINMLIGVVVFVLGIIVLILCCSKRFGPDILNEVIDHNDEFTLSSNIENLFITLLLLSLWEIFVPATLSIIYDECKSLYQLKNGS